MFKLYHLTFTGIEAGLTYCNIPMASRPEDPSIGYLHGAYWAPDDPRAMKGYPQRDVICPACLALWEAEVCS